MPDPLAALPPRFLRTPEAARFLGLSGRTLEKHRTYGTGPKYRKIGGRVVYALEDLKAWADLGAKTSTSDPGIGTVFPAKRIVAAGMNSTTSRLIVSSTGDGWGKDIPERADQLELFRALPGDLAPRDAQDLMAYPFFSLSKSHRVMPIDFRMGEVAIRVEATAEHGMATWASGEILRLLQEARVFRPQLVARFVLNRCGARTIIARETAEVLADHEPPVLAARVGQRVVFADPARTGRLVCEMPQGEPTMREIAALAAEIERIAR